MFFIHNELSLYKVGHKRVTDQNTHKIAIINNNVENIVEIRHRQDVKKSLQHYKYPITFQT